jgi:tocopherol O-methyltransferase
LPSQNNWPYERDKYLETGIPIRNGDKDSLTETSVKGKIQRFYDLGSPYYLSIYGEHIHDGYYVTGREFKKEAQDNLVKLLVEKAKIKKGARILDVGSGVGGSSIWMAKNLEAITLGITISPVQLGIAQRLAKEQKVNSQFLLMDAEQMHFTQSFDFIWVVAALTHFQNPHAFLKLATNYLDNHGKFIIFDWMPDESVLDPYNDPDIQPVSAGMLLASLTSLSSFLKWFINNGYRITYSEDITDRTIKTWDDASTVIIDPAAWKLIPRSSVNEVREFISFFRSIRAMKRSMQKGKLRSGAIVAEKI